MKKREKERLAERKREREGDGEGGRERERETETETETEGERERERVGGYICSSTLKAAVVDTVLTFNQSIKSLGPHTHTHTHTHTKILNVFTMFTQTYSGYFKGLDISRQHRNATRGFLVVSFMGASLRGKHVRTRCWMLYLNRLGGRSQ